MLQTRVFADKMENIREAGRKLEALEAEQVDLVTFREMFNCPYQTPNFPVYAGTPGAARRGRPAPTWRESTKSISPPVPCPRW